MSVEKIKITYRKQGKIRFLGHLDTMRIIFQAIRRAEIPVSYTNGFNPKIKCSFSPPLPLGFEGMEEFIELALDRKVYLPILKENLQENLLDGICIERIEKIPVFGKSLNSKIFGTEYEIGLDPDRTPSEYDRESETHSINQKDKSVIRGDGNSGEIEKRVDEFLKNKEIFVEKRNGKRINIRPLIFNFRIEGEKCIFSIEKETDSKLFMKKFLNLTDKDLARKKITRRRFLFK